MAGRFSIGVVLPFNMLIWGEGGRRPI